VQEGRDADARRIAERLERETDVDHGHNISTTIDMSSTDGAIFDARSDLDPVIMRRTS
jgi:hypothetical protein